MLKWRLCLSDTWAAAVKPSPVAEEERIDRLREGGKQSQKLKNSKLLKFMEAESNMGWRVDMTGYNWKKFPGAVWPTDTAPKAISGWFGYGMVIFGRGYAWRTDRQQKKGGRQKRGRKWFVQRTKQNVLKPNQAFGGRIKQGKKKEEWGANRESVKLTFLFQSGISWPGTLSSAV